MNEVRILWDGNKFLLITQDGWREYDNDGKDLPLRLIKQVEEIFGLREGW